VSDCDEVSECVTVYIMSKGISLCVTAKFVSEVKQSNGVYGATRNTPHNEQ
jgi:hypothetical protein